MRKTTCPLRSRGPPPRPAGGRQGNICTHEDPRITASGAGKGEEGTPGLQWPMMPSGKTGLQPTSSVSTEDGTVRPVVGRTQPVTGDSKEQH